MAGREQKAQVALHARKDSSFDSTFEDAQRKLEETHEKAEELGGGFSELGSKILELSGAMFVFDKLKEGIDSLVESWGELKDVGLEAHSVQERLRQAIAGQPHIFKRGTEYIDEQTEAVEKLVEAKSKLGTQSFSRPIEEALATGLSRGGLATPEKGLSRYMSAIENAWRGQGIFKPTEQDVDAAVDAFRTFAVRGRGNALMEMFPGLVLPQGKKSGLTKMTPEGRISWLLQKLDDLEKRSPYNRSTIEQAEEDLTKAQEDIKDKMGEIVLAISAPFDEILAHLEDAFGSGPLQKLQTAFEDLSRSLLNNAGPIIEKLEAIGTTIGNFGEKVFGDLFPSHPYSNANDPGGAGVGALQSDVMAQANDYLETISEAIEKLATDENAKTVANDLQLLGNAIDGLGVALQHSGQIANVISDFVTLWEHAATLQYWRVPGDVVNIKKDITGEGDKPVDRVEEIKKKFIESGQSVDQIKNTFVQMKGYGDEFAQHLGNSFDTIAAKIGTLSSTLAGNLQIVNAEIQSQHNTPKLPGHASGGIFGVPHLAEIAEKGPEAVVPLTGPKSRSWSVLAGAMARLGVSGGTSGGTVISPSFQFTITGSSSDAHAIADQVADIVIDKIDDLVSINNSRRLAA
jgi:hypothetical protein